MGVPYRCPICKGKKKVRKGFYPGKPESTTCETCWGQGIVWDNTLTTYIYPSSMPPRPSYVEPNYYQWQSIQMVQCGNCKQFHMIGDGHSCSVSFGMTGSNPPSVSEVATHYGEDYLHPGVGA